MTTKTTIVPKQPPPNFLAPYAEISPFKRLFMVVIILIKTLECKDGNIQDEDCYITYEINYMIPTFAR